MNYWAKKNTMTIKAKQHSADMERLYAPQIKKCAETSQVYTGFIDVEFASINNKNTNIILEESYSVDAVCKHTSRKTCVLNFASYKEPGGMFLQGSSAQEESLCHASILYNVLSRLHPYYDTNRERLNRSLYTNRAIYTPDVIFVKDGKEYKADVLTCAAPNKKAAQKYSRVSDFENNKVLRERIDFVLSAAALNAPEVLILGAYGCGVFGQDAIEVATIFKELLQNKYKNAFDVVVFAIPDINGENHQAFKKVFTETKTVII
jgi:uncharacterized protein (TIGR02452 family)